ncbi:MAG: NAD(P) transhydrogenase subunit alpha [Nocardioidaceae bacterium]|nr:NAD(P) transhydrogenase subunit alpha [Nocardioidaceae bacterium]
MRIAVARESRDTETRVALVPARVGELLALGHRVLVQPGAGAQAGHTDQEYRDAGAVLDEQALSVADLVLAVQPPEPAAIRTMPAGGVLICLAVGQDPDVHAALRDAGVTTHAMEQVPRLSRAQSMDALTSQALVAGYRGAIVAAGLLRRIAGVHMTAAGTVPAANVLVLGAGVAGLEAIATMHRLGARVRAYDVRASTAEEVRSLGADFVDLGLPPLDGAAGYAREMTEERAARQQRLLTPYVAEADVLITTAMVAGRAAPVLVSAAMVELMRPGSVVVDLAADAGGNVEGTVAGSIVRIGNAQVWGGRNVPAQLPGPASDLYARNVVDLAVLLLRNPDDEILVATRVAGVP